MNATKKNPVVFRWEAIDLTGFLGEALGTPDAKIVNYRELIGGASKDLSYFEVDAGDADGKEPSRYVVRRGADTISGTGLAIEGEFAVMQAAWEAGVRCPRPYWASRDADGNPFFVMDHIIGEALAPRLFRKEEYAGAREKIPAQMGNLLPAIHNVRPSDRLKEVLGEIPTANPAETSLKQFDEVFRTVAESPHPVIELALSYCRDRLPTQWDTTLVHGDYRLGNIIFDETGMTSILDWELAHWGDPIEDVTWPMNRAWRFGHDDKPVAGLGPREALTEAYCAAGGKELTPERLRWWEVFGNLKWGIMTLAQGAGFIAGTTRQLEKAVIGRRASEVEAELLNLIDD